VTSPDESQDRRRASQDSKTPLHSQMSEVVSAYRSLMQRRLPRAVVSWQSAAPANTVPRADMQLLWERPESPHPASVVVCAAEHFADSCGERSWDGVHVWFYPICCFPGFGPSKCYRCVFSSFYCLGAAGRPILVLHALLPPWLHWRRLGKLTLIFPKITAQTCCFVRWQDTGSCLPRSGRDNRKQTATTTVYSTTR